MWISKNKKQVGLWAGWKTRKKEANTEQVKKYKYKKDRGRVEHFCLEKRTDEKICR